MSSATESLALAYPAVLAPDPLVDADYCGAGYGVVTVPKRLLAEKILKYAGNALWRLSDLFQSRSSSKS